MKFDHAEMLKGAATIAGMLATKTRKDGDDEERDFFDYREQELFADQFPDSHLEIHSLYALLSLAVARVADLTGEPDEAIFRELALEASRRRGRLQGDV